MYLIIVSRSLWASWAIASVAVALAGPFGTFGAQTLIWRLVYWGGVIAAAIVIGIVLRAIWRKVLNGRPEWQEDLGVAASFSIIFAPVVVSVNRLLAVETAQHGLEFGWTIGCVFVIALTIIAVRYTLREPAQAQKKIRPRDRLMARISANPDARLSRISSDNHHIRIRTDDGAEHRLLMRLGDAVKETDVELGFLVHRSHWVARDVIVGIKRQEGRDMVELRCGTVLPIGPKYRANLSFADKVSA